jgi:hypothetical protein
MASARSASASPRASPDFNDESTSLLIPTVLDLQIHPRSPSSPSPTHPRQSSSHSSPSRWVVVLGVCFILLSVNIAGTWLYMRRYAQQQPTSIVCDTSTATRIGAPAARADAAEAAKGAVVACSPATCPPASCPECTCASPTAGYEQILAERAQLAASQVAERARAVSTQQWYCRLDSWVLGEWTADGLTFQPRTLVSPSDEGVRTSLSPSEQYHIYTPAEARDCLRGRPIAFLGPSYLRDMMTVLRDLLHGKPLRRGWHNVNPDPVDTSLLGGGFERLELVTANGLWRGWTKIEEAIPRFAGETVVADNLVWDVNKAAIEAHHGSRSTAVEVYFLQLRRFLTLCKLHRVNLIWLTQMSIEHGKGISTAPAIYRNAQTDEVFLALLSRTIPMLEEFDVPWLDVFHMAGNCVTDPTETDPSQPCNASAHSNWYVSLMKVHMLLNYLCRGCSDARAKIPAAPLSLQRMHEEAPGKPAWIMPEEGPGGGIG